MRPLDRKLVRDLGKMKGQMIAVGMIMVCGLAVMIMARSLILYLESTRDTYYIDYRFADIFCDLKRAPNSLRTRLAEISGIAAVETRVNGALVLDLPGMREPADGMMVSLPDDRPQQLNLLYLRIGRLPEIGSRNEVVVSEAFADAHGFQPGDMIDATIYGSRQRLRIVGIALSPEFVFESRARLQQAKSSEADGSGSIRIIAPIDGYVLNVYEENARVITAGTPIMEIGDPHDLEARIVTWHGDDVLQAPTGALFRRGDDWMTFVVEDERARLRKVGIDHNNGIAAEVLSGLSEQEVVIIYPPDNLTDGDSVAAGSKNVSE